MICPQQKCLKSLIQGVFALVCDVMASWLPPNPFKSAHGVGAALYNRFNTKQTSVKPGPCKTQRKSGICLLP